MENNIMPIKILNTKVQLRFTLLILLIFAYSFAPLMIQNLNPSENQYNQSEVFSGFVSSRVGTNDPTPPQEQFSAMDAIGTHTILVILVEFTDKTHTYEPGTVDDVIDDLNDYYQEASYGLTTVTGDTTTWIQLGKPREDYVDRLNGYSDPKIDLVLDALDAADSQADFSLYDGVTIIHAGQGQEISHDWQDYWSCEWWSTGPPLGTYDGKAIYRASVSPEEGAAGDPAYVGVIAHEFGHDLGLPDLYDIDYETEFVGHWGLMAKGSWNGQSGVGESPAHMMGWCKKELEYVNGSQLVDASSAFIGTVDPLEQSTTGVHLVMMPVTSQQYYLIEVRQQIGYDEYLPEKGVILTYVDESLDSGKGIVKVIDAHPSTATKDDGAFDLGAGEVDTYISSHGQFTMILEEAIGNSYEITLLRAYAQFDNPLDGSAILTPDFTISWTGSAAAPGIDHYELYLDDVLSYTGIGTSHPVTGAIAGLHNATLVMVLVDGGRRLTIQSNFVVDLVAPTIQTVTHLPSAPGFGDLVQIIVTATDDTWITNASVYYRRGTDPTWYQIDMSYISGSEWIGYLGTFLPGVAVTYYVSVTDAGGRITSDDNAGEYYNFTVSGLGLIIWLIIGGIAILIVCLAISRYRGKSSKSKWEPPPRPKPKAYSPTEPPTQQSRIDRPGFCFVCGAPLTPGATFCGNCGAKV
jgi:M6 family metalloprotease-like protein